MGKSHEVTILCALVEKPTILRSVILIYMI